MSMKLKELWAFLSLDERLICFLLLAMMLISAVLEIVGIGLIMPVIALLSKPELINQNKYLRIVHEIVTPSSNERFIILLSIILIGLYIFKNLFLIFQSYVQNRFIFGKGAKLCSQLFSSYIHAPYTFHLSQNTGHLMANLGMTTSVFSGVITPFMVLVTEACVVLCIFIMLIWLSPVVTFCLVGAIVAMTGIIYVPLKRMNYAIGQKMFVEEREVAKYAMQGIKAIKESKIYNVEEFFVEKYADHQKKRCQFQAYAIFLGNTPRFFIEIMIVFLGLGALIVLIVMGKNVTSTMLVLSLFAVSLVRMMPSLSRIQYAFTTIRQHLHACDVLFNDLANIKWDIKASNSQAFDFNKELVLDSLSFQYETNSSAKVIALNDKIRIAKNSSVAFVGKTGCGKTTLIDLLTGVIKPTQGDILVDGKSIETDLRSWQRKIGYVPQFIYLVDDSIKNNVGFGLVEETIDEKRVVECLRIAQIEDFVLSLSEGINSRIGENGLRLSGGQRQRLGIARALYHQPEILILDEATSALDNETEKAFVDALEILKGKLTIIMVAHRLSTVKNCDQIIRLDQ